MRVFDYLRIEIRSYDWGTTSWLGGVGVIMTCFQQYKTKLY